MNVTSSKFLTKKDIDEVNQNLHNIFFKTELKSYVHSAMMHRTFLYSDKSFLYSFEFCHGKIARVPLQLMREPKFNSVICVELVKLKHFQWQFLVSKLIAATESLAHAHNRHFWCVLRLKYIEILIASGKSLKKFSKD